MLVPAGRYDVAYREILAASRSADWAGAAPSSVLLLVATDVDALCAAHMLVNLLTTDCVGYRVRPVSGWTDLERAFAQEIIGNEELRTVVLINLGAGIDLYLDIEWPARIQVHVIDSHRPYQWHNLWLSDADNIRVWDDGEATHGMKDEHEAFMGLRANAERRAILRRIRGGESGTENSTDDEAVSENDPETPAHGPRKRQRFDTDGNALPHSIPRSQLRIFEKRKTKYYSRGTWYGQSVAGQIYGLATSLARGDNDLLWHALVGLTFQFIGGLIDAETYKSQLEAFGDEVARLGSSHAPVARSQKCNGALDRAIRPNDELRFTLHRHWNLFDAMLHSSYVAGKLQLWRERGRRNLNNLLAKMGFSLEQCQQTYAHMAMDLKHSLQHKLDALAPEYGLDDLIFPSFTRAFGYQSVLSASDMAETLIAMLEAAHGVRLDFGTDGFMTWSSQRRLSTPTNGIQVDNGKENRHPSATQASESPIGKGETPSTTSPTMLESSDAWSIKNFWTAWDALGPDATLLRNAIPLSMALHRSIIRQGTSLLDKRAVKALQGYRLAVLDEGPDLPVFAHPSTLSRLALWLVDTVREALRAARNSAPPPRELPFVVAALQEQRGVYLVVGVNGCGEYGDVRKNRFAVNFREAHEHMLADLDEGEKDDRIRLERFESSIIEVQKESLRSFLGKLNEVLAS